MRFYAPRREADGRVCTGSVAELQKWAETEPMKLLAGHHSGLNISRHIKLSGDARKWDTPCAPRMNKSVNHLKLFFSAAERPCTPVGMRRISNREAAQSLRLQKRCFTLAAPCNMSTMAGTIPAIRGYEAKRSVRGTRELHRQEENGSIGRTSLSGLLNRPTGIVRLFSPAGHQVFHDGTLRENSAP